MARGAASSASSLSSAKDTERNSQQQQQQQQQQQAEQKASKRRCVQSACIPCRRRKSKCDGGVPVCATCTAVYKTECFYDAANETRRASKSTASSSSAAGTKRDASTISSSTSSLPQPSGDHAEFLISTIRSLPESEVYELIQHIRKDARLDIAALADSWRRTVTLPPPTPLDPQSLESDLSVLLGKTAMTQSGESRYFGHTSGLSLVPEDENYTRSRRRASSVEPKPRTWTRVTQDIAFVERLLDLYFKWSHPFYIIFSRECFLKDFGSGREKYCSPLLVNAILAYACHFTDEPAGRTDPDNFRTAGDHFFAEARRLLFEDESSSLTTCQALCVMAMREPSAGRDSSGFMYIGRCMRMCVEMGLHLNNSASPQMELTPSEIEVRKVTFWGCFTVDTVWSLCVGRISQLPRAAITLDKPILEEPQMGLLSAEAYLGASQVPPGTVTTRMFLQEFSTLSQLVNDNTYMFFAPKERFTSRRLLDCYSKYQNWYKQLPQTLRLEGAVKPQPHIIVLHMLYHTVIVHLFRPMLKVELVHSDVRPRDACIDAANQVAKLLRQYRTHYGMRACQLVLTHILLSVSIVHLLYSRENAESKRNLVECLQGLEDLSTCHYFGGRSFKIIYALAQRWNLPWPDELKDSKLVPNESSGVPIGGIVSPSASVEGLRLMVPPGQPNSIESRMGGASGYGPVAPAAQPTRRESLSMFANMRPERASTQMPSHPASSRPSSMVPSQRHHSHSHQSPVHHPRNTQPPSQQHTPVAITPYAPPPPNSQSQAPSTYAQSIASSSSALLTPATNSAETLFWTPVPGVGVPILPRDYGLSPMDLNNMLGDVGEWDRFGRDGFKMSESWLGSGSGGSHEDIGVNGFSGPGGADGGHMYTAGQGQNAIEHGGSGQQQQQQQQHHHHHHHAVTGGHPGFDTANWWSGESGENPGLS